MDERFLSAFLNLFFERTREMSARHGEKDKDASSYTRARIPFLAPIMMPRLASIWYDMLRLPPSTATLVAARRALGLAA